MLRMNYLLVYTIKARIDKKIVKKCENLNYIMQ